MELDFIYLEFCYSNGILVSMSFLGSIDGAFFRDLIYLNKYIDVYTTPITYRSIVPISKEDFESFYNTFSAVVDNDDDDYVRRSFVNTVLDFLKYIKDRFIS